MTDPARQAALEVLTAVREQDAYTNLVLPAVLRRHGLTGRDAGLVEQIERIGRGQAERPLFDCTVHFFLVFNSPGVV